MEKGSRRFPGVQPSSSSRVTTTGGEMVFFALLVGAELDGLTNLQPTGGVDDRTYPYYFKVRFLIPRYRAPFPLHLSDSDDFLFFSANSDSDDSDGGCLSGARTARRPVPSPPASPSTRSSNSPAAKAPPTSSRRCHLSSLHASSQLICGFSFLPVWLFVALCG